MHRLRHAFACIFILVGLVLPVSIRAESHLRIIVAFPAGGAMDKMARAVAAELATTSFGKPVVENRPGADGLVAINAILTQGESGTSLLMIGPYFTTALANGKLSPDKASRLKPVIHLGEVDIYLIANHRLGIKNLAGLSIPVAKPWSCASTGGQFTTICELLGREYPGNVISVPYRGEAQGLNDLLGGHVDLMPITGMFAGQHLAAGTVSLVANLSAPVDNLFDSGSTLVFRNPIKSFYGLMAFSDMPSSRIDQLNRDINKVLKSNGVQAIARAVGLNLVGGSPTGLEMVLRENTAVQMRMLHGIR